MSGREIVILVCLCSCSGNQPGSGSNSTNTGNGRNGNIGVIYEDSIPGSEELMGVSHEGKWGYVNLRGELVVPFQFVGVSPFKNGKAVVEEKGEEWSRLKYIDKSGKVTGDLAPLKNKKSFAAGDVIYGNMPEGVHINGQQEEEFEPERIALGKAITVAKNDEWRGTSKVNMFTGKWLPVVEADGSQGWILDLYLLNFNPDGKPARCETWVLTRSNKADESYSQGVLQKFSSGALNLRTTGWEKSKGKATFPGLSVGQVVLYYFLTNPGLKGFTLTYSLDVHYNVDKKSTLTFSTKRDPQGSVKTFSLSATTPGIGKFDYEFVQESDGVSVTETYSTP